MVGAAYGARHSPPKMGETQVRQVLERLFWLQPNDDWALLTHAICGDALAPPGDEFGGAWFEARGVSRGAQVVMLRYETARAAIGICVNAPSVLSADWIVRLRDDLSPRGAERRWGPFISKLGKYQPVAALATPSEWIEDDLIVQGRNWRARRMRHPSALIDRLALRDRIEGEARLVEAFAVQAAGHVGREHRVAHAAEGRC